MLQSALFSAGLAVGAAPAGTEAAREPPDEVDGPPDTGAVPACGAGAATTGAAAGARAATTGAAAGAGLDGAGIDGTTADAGSLTGEAAFADGGAE